MIERSSQKKKQRSSTSKAITPTSSLPSATIPLSDEKAALALFQPDGVALDVMDDDEGAVTRGCFHWTTTATIIDGHKGFVGWVIRSSEYQTVESDGGESWYEEIAQPSTSPTRLDTLNSDIGVYPHYSIELRLLSVEDGYDANNWRTWYPIIGCRFVPG